MFLNVGIVKNAHRIHDCNLLGKFRNMCLCAHWRTTVVCPGIIKISIFIGITLHASLDTVMQEWVLHQVAHHLSQECYTPKRERFCRYTTEKYQGPWCSICFPLTASLLWSWACLVEAVAKSHRSCGKDLLLENLILTVIEALIFFFMTDSHASVRLIVASISLQTGTRPPAQPSKCSSEQWGC